MVVVVIPKELNKEKNLIAVPHKAYEEFLAWQKKVRAAKIYNPTAAEKRMIARARRNFTKGNYVTWEKVKHELGLDN